MRARSHFRPGSTVSAVLVLAAMLAAVPARAQAPTMPPESRIPNPAARDGAVDPADVQRALAFKIFPSLLELGLDVVPGDDQARSVLTAVNLLRRQDSQRPFVALNDEVVAYVDQKVVDYRTQRSLTIRIQGALDALGFEPGPIDGIYGPLTTEGVRRYQRSAGMPPTGALTAAQVDALEMRSIDQIMRPARTTADAPAKQPADSRGPTGNASAVVATPAKAPEIDPDVLDYIGR